MVDFRRRHCLRASHLHSSQHEHSHANAVITCEVVKSFSFPRRTCCCVILVSEKLQIKAHWLASRQERFSVFGSFTSSHLEALKTRKRMKMNAQQQRHQMLTSFSPTNSGETKRNSDDSDSCNTENSHTCTQLCMFSTKTSTGQSCVR